MRKIVNSKIKQSRINTDIMIFKKKFHKLSTERSPE